MRVSIDIDRSVLLSLMAYYNMRQRYSQSPMMYRTANNGVHFVERDLPLTWEEAALERTLFHDDQNRIDLDMECVKPFQILFGKKREDRDRPSRHRWPLDERSLLALPFWLSRIVRKR